MGAGRKRVTGNGSENGSGDGAVGPSVRGQPFTVAKLVPHRKKSVTMQGDHSHHFEGAPGPTPFERRGMHQRARAAINSFV